MCINGLSVLSSGHVHLKIRPVAVFLSISVRLDLSISVARHQGPVIGHALIH